MHYMLFLCDDGESDMVDDPGGATLTGLRPAAEAVTVRVRDGRVLVTHGPVAPATAAIGGFGIVECADLDEALERAGKHPAARDHAVEIRPFWEDAR